MNPSTQTSFPSAQHLGWRWPWASPHVTGGQFLSKRAILSESCNHFNSPQSYGKKFKPLANPDVYIHSYSFLVGTWLWLKLFSAATNSIFKKQKVQNQTLGSIGSSDHLITSSSATFARIWECEKPFLNKDTTSGNDPWFHRFQSNTSSFPQTISGREPSLTIGEEDFHLLRCDLLHHDLTQWLIWASWDPTNSIAQGGWQSHIASQRTSPEYYVILFPGIFASLNVCLL